MTNNNLIYGSGLLACAILGLVFGALWAQPPAITCERGTLYHISHYNDQADAILHEVTADRTHARVQWHQLTKWNHEPKLIIIRDACTDDFNNDTHSPAAEVY